MMGGAWAYESLTFGGYWAWDPVENASLVPWLILVGGIHTMLAYKKSGHSLRSTFLFFLLSFILVLYSTFLTRSGILGNSSVHAFTDLGMSGHLVFYLLGLTIPAIILLAINWKKSLHPKRKKQWLHANSGFLLEREYFLSPHFKSLFILRFRFMHRLLNGFRNQKLISLRQLNQSEHTILTNCLLPFWFYYFHHLRCI